MTPDLADLDLPADTDASAGWREEYAFQAVTTQMEEVA